MQRESTSAAPVREDIILELFFSLECMYPALTADEIHLSNS